MTKVKKFCRITKYLETIDKELHAVLDDLCLFGLFRSRGPGVTFLYPTDKDYRKKIATLAYGNTPEKAVDMIKALVLSDYLPNVADFGNKKDNIGNMLRKKLEVDKVEKDVVLLKGGLKLKLDDKFIAMHSDDSMVVYSLSGKGELSLTSGAASVKYTQSKPSHGGSIRGGCGSAIEFAKWIEDTYKSQKSDKKNAYQAAMAYTYYRATQCDEKVDICKQLVAGMSAGARSSFYTIFSPYCQFGLSNLNSEFVGQCYEMKRDMESCFDSYPTHYADYRDKVIKIAREGTSSNEENELSDRHTEQMKVINGSSTNTVVYQVKEQYTNSGELARDLFSVYNYLSLIKENTEPGYYETCFLWIVRNVYTTISDITEHSVDLAHNMTIYGNLVRSDAYKYYPINTTQVRTHYKSLGLELPEPVQKTLLFTIEQNKETGVHGGSSVRSVAELNEMMLGGLE
jgi:hypothetical protein